jgi:hypothetical protein
VQTLRGAVLVGALAVVVLMILLLWQMNTHVASLDNRTGVLQEQIVGGRSARGPALQSSVRDILPTLREVRGKLRDVSADTSNITLLRSVDTQLGTLERNTELIAVLPQLNGQLSGMSRSLQTISVLPALLDELKGLRADTGQIPGLVKQLDRVGRELHAVQRSVGALPPILDDMLGHLENIDKKTGPAPPVP